MTYYVFKDYPFNIETIVIGTSYAERFETIEEAKMYQYESMISHCKSYNQDVKLRYYELKAKMLKKNNPEIFI